MEIHYDIMVDSSRPGGCFLDSFLYSKQEGTGDGSSPTQYGALRIV